MPTKATESSCYYPGALVEAAANIYSSVPIDGDEDNQTITQGTVGVIVSGPDGNHRHHYQVQFLRNILWWVLPAEISPYVGY